jgi:hypothetical protein
MQDKSRQNSNSKTDVPEDRESGKSAFGVNNTPTRKGTLANPPVHITPKKPAQTNLDQWASNLPLTNEHRTTQSALPPNSNSFPSPTTRSEKMQAEFDRLNQQLDSHRKQTAPVRVEDYQEAPIDANEGTNEKSLLDLNIKKEPGTDSPPKDAIQGVP